MRAATSGGGALIFPRYVIPKPPSPPPALGPRHFGSIRGAWFRLYGAAHDRQFMRRRAEEEDAHVHGGCPCGGAQGGARRRGW